MHIVHNLECVCDTLVAVVYLLFVLYLCPSSQWIRFVPIVTVLEGQYALELRAGRDSLVTSINNNDDATLFAGHEDSLLKMLLCHLQVFLWQSIGNKLPTAVDLNLAAAAAANRTGMEPFIDTNSLLKYTFFCYGLNIYNEILPHYQNTDTHLESFVSVKIVYWKKEKRLEID
jgi:hypothetical protein